MAIQNSQLMYDVIEKMDSMVRVMDQEDTIIFMNEKMRTQFGDFRGKKCYEMLGLMEPCRHCVSDLCLKTGKAEGKENQIDNSVYQIVASPVMLSDQEDEKYAIEIFQDVTDNKRVEQENLKHYQRLKEDMKFAKYIQKSVLPINDRYWDSLYAASFYQPSEDLSGDLFDIVKLDESRSLFYMADVSGHGIRSSLLTIFLRQIIRSNKAKEREASEILQELITEYHLLNVEAEQYFTIVIGIYDKKKGEIQFINAGHNCPPIMMRMDGSIEEVEVSGMPVCSLVKKVNHQVETVSVQQGDRILLYTDGVSEAYSDEKKRAFEIEGIMETLHCHKEKSSVELVEYLIHDVEEFSKKENKDDMAVLVLEVL